MTRPRAIVVCEFSQRVTLALRKAGVEAYSCDLQDTEGNPAWHIKADCRTLDYSGYDGLIAHPDCTHLAVSGARWNVTPERQQKQREAIEFVKWLWSLPIANVGLENPIGVLSTLWQKPTQIIQPWWFGDMETKATCLWIRGFPKLTPTNQVFPAFHSVHMEPPGPDRKKNRSRTFQGIANAMADQWGRYLMQEVMARKSR